MLCEVEPLLQRRPPGRLVADASDEVPERAPERLERLVEDRLVECVLRAEVVVHRGAVRAGPSGDLAHRGVAVALLGEQLARRREDLPPDGLRPPLLRALHRLPSAADAPSRLKHASETGIYHPPPPPSRRFVPAVPGPDRERPGFVTFPAGIDFGVYFSREAW